MVTGVIENQFMQLKTNNIALLESHLGFAPVRKVKAEMNNLMRRQ
jgi:hypothetical protein